ncbi:MAG TPA: beta-N-acetylglucosaminidase domain-containing protein [Acidimicrobiia bacterium]|nr:beta-N-acetylglucosaminidase domain-containing protein [Acidimicrobiia bacterium]
MPGAFRVRGIVEGFYGPPWSHAARLDVLSFVGERGMNTYVYAPKDEPKHRAQWREPYDPDEIETFAHVRAHAAAVGITTACAISPGLDIDYDAPPDRAALLAKLQPLLDVGITWIVLALDDIPLSPGLAPRQGALATWLLDELRGSSADARLTVCPTEYVGTRAGDYLSTLGQHLPMEIDVMWTGPTVCSPELRADDAATWRAAAGGRSVIVWDNFPVNDGMMDRALHLGPYTGREARLSEVVEGVLCNPMVQPYASLVGLATACEFLRDPDVYDPWEAWERAIHDVGGDRSTGLRALARACADSPLAPPATLPLMVAVDALAADVGGPGWRDTIADMARELRAARALDDVFPADGDARAAELAPWASAAAREARAGLAALALLQHLHPVATLDERGRGVARGPDADACLQRVFGVVFAWADARRNERIVYGPRFTLHPAIVRTDDDRTVLDIDLAVRDDENAIDALCRLALEHYRAWTHHPVGALRVLVDGVERNVAVDGGFDADGAVALVRCGTFSTRVTGATEYPFTDARLS